MSSKTPKTGLAGRMRAWMREQTRPFTVLQICNRLEMLPGKERDKARNAMPDFLKRGEVVVVVDKRIRRQPARRYRYIHAWKRGSKCGDIEGKIYKAMRLVSFEQGFAVSDIQRLTGITERNYIDKLTRKLLKDGHLRREGYRSRTNSYGREAIYRVVNTDRFRLEVMR